MTAKLGIIAGGKDLPKQVVEHCRATERPYHIIAFNGQTDPETVEGSEHTWLSLGAVGKAIKALHQAEVKEIVMVGPLRRPSWYEIRPDGLGAKWLARLAKGAFGDDSMFRIIIEEIEKQGFRVIGVDELIGEDLLAPQGLLGKHQPDETAHKDILHGVKISQPLGQADIGQALIVQNGVVLGVEAAEGTNELIKRCKDLAKKGAGGVLVKFAKKGQDRRVDLPTIGPETIQLAYENGLRGVAVEAGNVQVLHREKVIQLADRYKLFVIGVKSGDL